MTERIEHILDELEVDLGARHMLALGVQHGLPELIEEKIIDRGPSTVIHVLSEDMKHGPSLVEERIEVGEKHAELESHLPARPLPRQDLWVARRVRRIELTKALLHHRRHVVRVPQRLHGDRRVAKLASPIDLPMTRRGHHRLPPHLVGPPSDLAVVRLGIDLPGSNRRATRLEHHHTRRDLSNPR